MKTHTVWDCNRHWLTRALSVISDHLKSKTSALWDLYHSPLGSGFVNVHDCPYYSWQDFRVQYDWCPTDYPLSERLHRNRLLRASKRLIEKWGKPPSNAAAIIRAAQRKTGICLIHITAGPLICWGSMKSEHRAAAALKGNDTRERADREK